MGSFRTVKVCLLACWLFCTVDICKAQQCNGSYSLNNGDYQIQWNLVGPSLSNINITVTVDTASIQGSNGGFWVGLGFSNSTTEPFMYPADVAYAAFPANENSGRVEDRYTVGHSAPLVDAAFSDIRDDTTSRNGSKLTMSFVRPIVSSDVTHDFSLDVPRYWIWAVGSLLSPTDPIQHSAGNRGLVTESPIELLTVNECTELELSTGANLTVEIGRSVDILCRSNNQNINTFWNKLVNGTWIRVEELQLFINDNLIRVPSGTDTGVDTYILPGEDEAGITNFQSNLFQTFLDTDNDLQLRLSSWMFSRNQRTYTIITNSDISGTYACILEEESTNKIYITNVTIEVEVPSPEAPFSRAYIRQEASFEFIFPFTSQERLQLTIMESFFLESIPVEREGLQTIECRDLRTSFFDPSIDPRIPIECIIKEYPPQPSTLLLAEQVLDVFRAQATPGSSMSAETGFCDEELTQDPVYGANTWPLAKGGETVTVACEFSNGTASRTCLGSEEGWNIIVDYTNCRNIVVHPNPLEFYLRFSSDNFTSTLAPDISVNNIRIIIELSSNSIFASCSSVPMRIDSVGSGRVECRINGTTESQPGSIADQQLVINSLVALGLLILDTTSSNGIGFCDADSTEGPEGTNQWPEVPVGTTIALPCQFGPFNATVIRSCVSRSNWGPPDATSCATTTTQGLQALEESLNEINTNNVADFTNNLTIFINNANSAIDQSEENVEIVLRSLVRTSEIVQLGNVTLPARLMVLPDIDITRDIVIILDDVEEWPEENIIDQSPLIIMAFENVTANLVLQENFTNLTVVTDDIALVAERLNGDDLEQNGRTFTVNQLGGALQVNSGSQTNQTLQENQPAVLTFPSGIDLQELLMDNNGDDDVGIFFVVYEEDTWFPVKNNKQDSNPVGSAVVSFTIAGLPSGTTLPQPISINLRIADPITGSSENITNATCVFYNFTSLRWDPTGCETIFDPDVNPDEVTCRCSHLTNFASLVDISARLRERPPPLTVEQRVSLEVISYVGVTLSLLGLLVTVVTLLIFKKIRKRDSTKFHLQFCISLACMYIVFVSGIDSTDNRGGCITVGVMIHYFTLVAWMWMGAEALLMFQKLIIVFGTITWKYILFISVLCWSIPVVPVLISVSVDPDHYITIYNDNTTRPGFCFISNIGVFFGAFLGPIFLVMIFNTVIYVLVIRVIVKHNLDKNKDLSRQKMIKILISICGIMFLFGLSWVFAVFTFITTDRDASYAFQFIFTLLNALQGLWIFVFFVVLTFDPRDWYELLCRGRKSAPSTSKMDMSTSKDKYFKTASKAPKNGKMSTIGDHHVAAITNENDYVSTSDEFPSIQLQTKDTIEQTPEVHSTDVEDRSNQDTQLKSAVDHDSSVDSDSSFSNGSNEIGKDEEIVEETRSTDNIIETV